MFDSESSLADDIIGRAIEADKRCFDSGDEFWKDNLSRLPSFYNVDQEVLQFREYYYSLPDAIEEAEYIGVQNYKNYETCIFIINSALRCIPSANRVKLNLNTNDLFLGIKGLRDSFYDFTYPNKQLAWGVSSRYFVSLEEKNRNYLRGLSFSPCLKTSCSFVPLIICLHDDLYWGCVVRELKKIYTDYAE